MILYFGEPGWRAQFQEGFEAGPLSGTFWNRISAEPKPRTVTAIPVLPSTRFSRWL